MPNPGMGARQGVPIWKDLPGAVRLRIQPGLEERWGEVSDWLSGLSAAQDMTLLCHEREGEFCHRKLVAQLVRKHRPDIQVELH